MIWNAYFTGILCWLEKGLNLAIGQFQQLIILQVGGQLSEKRQQALKTSNTRLNIWWKPLGVNLTRFKHFKSEFEIRKIFEQFNI